MNISRDNIRVYLTTH